MLALHHPARPVAWGGVTLLGASDPVPAGTWTVDLPGGGRAAGQVRLPGARDLPEEIEHLVHEANALDPGGVPGYPAVLGGGADADAQAAAATRRDWWTLWSDPTAWRTPPAGRFTLLGVPPCPLAVTRPSRAWVPLHVDYRVQWSPVARGAAGFPLGELDFEPPEPWPDADGARELVGRGLLHDGPAQLLRLAHNRAQSGGFPFPVPDWADACACSLHDLIARIRGTPEGLWFSPSGIDDIPPDATVAAESYVPVPLAAGAWAVRDLRVVDAFGRVLALVSGGTGPEPRVPAELTAAGAPGVVLRPRFTAPLTLDARFLDPGGATAADGTPVEVSTGQNPLAGWLAPTPVDGSAELFAPDGRSLGRLAIDPRGGRTAWEDTPQKGAVATATDPLDRIGVAPVARMARSLIEADRARTPASRSDTALGALLRLVDATLPLVDATSATGTGHLGLLLGTPLAIVRVLVTVDVDDPQAGRAGSLASQLTPMRLGSPARLTDGVIAFWVEDQPDRLNPVHPLVAGAAPALPGDDGAGPIDHPYVATDPVVWVQPGRPRTLTVLVAPGAQLTFTCGLAPRKTLDLLPEWTELPAGTLTPTLAFDAVLRAPNSLELPTADDINGVWTWYRRAPGETAWTGEELGSDQATAALGSAPARVEDGYLRVTLLPPPDIKGVKFQVVCIRRWGPAKTIQEIGVRNPDGSIARLPVDEAIRQIDLGRIGFYVDVGGQPAALTVDTAPSGRRYLRTEFDTTKVNNLAGLPECT